MWPVRGCVQWTRCQGRTISVGTSISLRVAGTDIDWAKNGPGENHGPLFQDNDLTRLRSEQLDYDRVDPNDSDLAREEIAFAKQLSGLVPRLELLSLFSGSPTGDRALEPVEVPRKVGCRRRGATCVALSTKGKGSRSYTG